MSSIDASVTDRVYHFISDPDHKENLSGRVRAACLTCRRKKIKCSGEANCKTCQEKGLVCEGLPERKRARNSVDLHDRSKFGQNSLSPTHGDLISVSRRDSTRSSSTDMERRRSSVQRRPFVTSAASSENVDSDYTSNSHSPVQSIVDARPQGQFVGRDASFRISSPTDWKVNANFDSPRHQDGFSKEGSIGSESQGVLPPPKSQLKWQESYAGPEATTGSPGINSILSTAELLEGQAQSLRRLASRQATTHSRETEPNRCSVQPRHSHMADYSLANGHSHDSYGPQAPTYMDPNLSNTMPTLDVNYGSWWGVDQSIANTMSFSYQQNHDQAQSHLNKPHQSGVWDSAAQALRYAIPTVSPPPVSSRIQQMQWPLPSQDTNQQYQWSSQG